MLKNENDCRKVGCQFLILCPIQKLRPYGERLSHLKVSSEILKLPETEITTPLDYKMRSFTNNIYMFATKASKLKKKKVFFLPGSNNLAASALASSRAVTHFCLSTSDVALR